MATEIERKFLLADDTWRAACTRRRRIVDGLVAATADRKVRVRLYPDHATLTLKAGSSALVRAEYEYPIPEADAREMLARHCGDSVLEKIRHDVPYAGFLWEIDVYTGVLNGIVVAEVELPRADIHLPLPPWAGREITDDPAYKKRALLAARRAPQP